MEYEYKCYYCGKDFNPPRYYWRGLSPIYCSAECAAWGYENGELIKDEI